MRIPHIENYKDHKNYEYVSINEIERPTRSYTIMNEKDKIKLIKTVEKIVRRSIEYKQYIHFLRSEIDMTSCTFFKNVNTTGNAKIRIEIHHEPFTLFDITDVVVNKFIALDMELNPLLISDEVMAIHYRNMVGLIPLSKTVHDLVHDGKIFIPLQNVFGGFINFIEEYEEYIPTDIMELLKMKIKMSKETEVDTSLLATKYVYLNIDGFELPHIIAV
jgi:hypothetical protein